MPVVIDFVFCADMTPQIFVTDTLMSAAENPVAIVTLMLLEEEPPDALGGSVQL